MDPGESYLFQFLAYVVAALRSAYPRCCVDTSEILLSTIQSDPAVLAGSFCNDVDHLGEPFVLILDDYYRISSPEVYAFIDTVLKRPPRNLHLVIISRYDPGLSLQALRANGTLTEVRLKQLAFQEEESRAFIRGSLGDRITESEISQLHYSVEGWPVALRLAVLAAPEQSSTQDFVDSIPADTHAVRAYLIKEVLAKQPAEVRECLLRLACLDRFCEDLC